MVEGKILVIDDEEDICKVLKQWLEAKGYAVFYKTSAEDGLRAFKADVFPVVMLDIRMPDMDGVAVLKKIKEMSQDTVVILMTGFPSDDTIGEALASGAYDYLVKPFQVDRIDYLVGRAFSFFKLKNAARKPKA